jgi:uncharacterized protein YxjI
MKKIHKIKQQLESVGYYVEIEDMDGKYLIVKKKPAPTTWRPNLVCVVDNGVFEAAGYAFDEREMHVFLRPDGRNKTWLEYSHAETLAE